VLAFDITIVAIAFHYAYLIRFGFNFGEVEKHLHFYQPIFVITIYTLVFLFTGSYSGIIRHSGPEDATKIIKASLLSGTIIFFFTASNLFDNILAPEIIISRGVIIIHSLLILLILISSRLVIRSVYITTKPNIKDITKVVIYGAGSAGVLTKKSLLQDPKINYEVDCFVDDNPTLHNKFLLGTKIAKPTKVFKKPYISKHKIDEIIIAITNINPNKKNEIVEKCLDLNIKTRIIPSVEKWVNGELSNKQIKNVNIEDLLERQPIELDNHYTTKEIKDNIVLVTGAAGCIGSEIVRQLITKKPKKILLFEFAESPLHDLRMELGTKLSKEFPSVDLHFIIGDIRNREFVNNIFQKYQPKIVYHAAAYKHVPLMEEFPDQAVSTNIKGTKNVADAAVKAGVHKFVMVSTDKAVNPTNVMGASKRIAEIYIQSLSKIQDNTKFITTRFGNVLGSNGSVIPMFKKQIEAGGPLTVTHKDITRFFMTIPEACQLVLEAGAMGKGGEIFIFDMGKSVKVYDIAKKMIRLSGYSYPDDINIVFSGLRPGEKLYEELLANKENTIPTYHPKIMVAKIRDINYTLITTKINELTAIDTTENYFELVSKMKIIVPEFISNNSKYEALDDKTESQVS
jgi:FlaA1/EpsC-like NDP-sugar epimerase